MLMIETNSFYFKSADENIMKNVGTPNCFTMAKTSNKNFFQYAGVLLEVTTKHSDFQLI